MRFEQVQAYATIKCHYVNKFYKTKSKTLFSMINHVFWRQTDTSVYV